MSIWRGVPFIKWYQSESSWVCKQITKHEAVCTRTCGCGFMKKVIKMPPWRNCDGGRNICVLDEGCRALQGQVQALQKELCRWFKPRIRDGSEDKVEEEAQFKDEQDAVEDPKQVRLLKALISKIGKVQRLKFLHFLEILLELWNKHKTISHMIKQKTNTPSTQEIYKQYMQYSSPRKIYKSKRLSRRYESSR